MLCPCKCFCDMSAGQQNGCVMCTTDHMDAIGQLAMIRSELKTRLRGYKRPDLPRLRSGSALQHMLHPRRLARFDIDKPADRSAKARPSAFARPEATLTDYVSAEPILFADDAAYLKDAALADD